MKSSQLFRGVPTTQNGSRSESLLARFLNMSLCPSVRLPNSVPPERGHIAKMTSFLTRFLKSTTQCPLLSKQSYQQIRITLKGLLTIIPLFHFCPFQKICCFILEVDADFIFNRRHESFLIHCTKPNSDLYLFNAVCVESLLIIQTVLVRQDSKILQHRKKLLT